MWEYICKMRIWNSFHVSRGRRICCGGERFHAFVNRKYRNLFFIKAKWMEVIKIVFCYWFSVPINIIGGKLPTEQMILLFDKMRVGKFIEELMRVQYKEFHEIFSLKIRHAFSWYLKVSIVCHWKINNNWIINNYNNSLFRIFLFSQFWKNTFLVGYESTAILRYGTIFTISKHIITEFIIQLFTDNLSNITKYLIPKIQQVRFWNFKICCLRRDKKNLFTYWKNCISKGKKLSTISNSFNGNTPFGQIFQVKYIELFISYFNTFCNSSAVVAATNSFE